MATLSALTTAIHSVIQDDSYTDLTDRINEAVNSIAGGIRIPDGTTSPPLPDLYTSATIPTTVNAYTDLPSNYQRGLFYDLILKNNHPFYLGRPDITARWR